MEEDDDEVYSNGSDRDDARGRASARSRSGPSKPKKKKYLSKYRTDWEKDSRCSSWLGRSKNGCSFCFCTLCQVDINIQHAGFSDILKHASGQKHSSAQRAKESHSNSASVLETLRKANTLRQGTSEAEIRISAFIAEHNLSFRLTDHLTQLMTQCFPDSQIARGLKLGRTKCTCIVNNVIGEQCHHDLVEMLKMEKFSIIIDESTDRSSQKQLCMVVRYYDKGRKQIRDQFYRLLQIHISATADILYDMITSEFNREGIPYVNNIVGFAGDGANVIFGAHNSVASRFKKEIPNIFLMKCICHSFHLVASYACLELPRFIEDLVRDVYAYFNCSPQRMSKYRELQTILRLKPHRMLHPAQTRWLSLLPAISRLLEQYDGLIRYFTEAVDSDKLNQTESILKRLKDPQTRVFLEFLRYVLPLFHNLNLLFQSEKVQIHRLYENVISIYKSLLSMFIKPDVLNNATDADIVKILISNPSNLKLNQDVDIGIVADMYLQKGELPEVGRIDIRRRCLNFLLKAAEQIKFRFDFNNLFLKNIRLLDPQNIKNVQSLASLLCHFPVLTIANIQNIDREWRDLKTILHTFDVSDMEKFWYQVKEEKFVNKLRFPHLCDFVFSEILILPHSSANVERIFSMLNLNKTPIRNKLSNNSLNGILNSKAYMFSSSCYNFQIHANLLERKTITMYDFKNKETEADIVGNVGDNNQDSPDDSDEY